MSQLKLRVFVCFQSTKPKNMDKLTLISGTLFMAADIFAIVSLAMPDWIITDVGGKGKHVFETYTKSSLDVFRRHPIRLNVDVHDTL